MITRWRGGKSLRFSQSSSKPPRYERKSKRKRKISKEQNGIKSKSKNRTAEQKCKEKSKEKSIKTNRKPQETPHQHPIAMVPVPPRLPYDHADCHFAISAVEISRFSAVSRCKVPACRGAEEEKNRVISKSPKKEDGAAPLMISDPMPRLTGRYGVEHH